jgi:rhamnogalacturonan II specific xylosyltransferase
MSLHQRPHQKPPAAGDSIPVSSPSAATAPSRPLPLLTLPYLFSLLALLLFAALLLPWGPTRPSSAPASPWRAYTLQEAAAFAAAAGNGTVLLAAVSGPYLPFLSNWLISVRRAGRADQVLVIAEDYETLDRINAAWPGHAVLVPPAPDAQVAHKFGSQVRRNPSLPKLLDEMSPCVNAAISFILTAGLLQLHLAPAAAPAANS